VLYSATGSGTNVDGAWDGSGASQDGAYDVTLEMTDQAANVAVVTAEVVRDTTPPAVSDLAVSNEAFSPNGDGVKDETTITATLTDTWTPISWTLQIKQGTMLVMTASGTGNVSYAWDGIDDEADPIDDGTYVIDLTATDGGNNSKVAVPLSVLADSTSPEITAVVPQEGSQTLFPQQPLFARVGDALAGIEEQGVTFTLIPQSGGAQVLVGGPDGDWYRTPPAGLSVGATYRVEVDAVDRAGNVGVWDAPTFEAGGGFVVVEASAPPGSAEIPDMPCSVSAIDPTTASRTATCSDIGLALTAGPISFSEVARGGSGFIPYDFPLSTAVVTTRVLGVEFTQPAAGNGSRWRDGTVNLPFRVKPASAGVTVPVGPRVVDLGTAQFRVPASWDSVTLRMDPVATVAGPWACADSLSDGRDCLPDPVRNRRLGLWSPNVPFHVRGCDMVLAGNKVPFIVDPLTGFSAEVSWDQSAFSPSSAEMVFALDEGVIDSVPGTLASGGDAFSFSLSPAALGTSDRIEFAFVFQGDWVADRCDGAEAAVFPSLAAFEGAIASDAVATQDVTLVAEEAMLTAQVQTEFAADDEDELCAAAFTAPTPCDLEQPPAAEGPPTSESDPLMLEIADAQSADCDPYTYLWGTWAGEVRPREVEKGPEQKALGDVTDWPTANSALQYTEVQATGKWTLIPQSGEEDAKITVRGRVGFPVAITCSGSNCPTWQDAKVELWWTVLGRGEGDTSGLLPDGLDALCELGEIACPWEPGYAWADLTSIVKAGHKTGIGTSEWTSTVQDAMKPGNLSEKGCRMTYGSHPWTKFCSYTHQDSGMVTWNNVEIPVNLAQSEMFFVDLLTTIDAHTRLGSYTADARLSFDRYHQQPYLRIRATKLRITPKDRCFT
ncbi:MAG TPA: hypothetical protein VGB83_13115, partial [Actinomycetota bacterium]